MSPSGSPRATGHQIGLDTATRYLLEAGDSGPREEQHEAPPSTRRATSYAAGDEFAVLKLKRLFQDKRVLLFYRLQFVGPSDGPRLKIVEEREVRASSVASALTEMSAIDSPRKSISEWLVDLDGAVLWERSRHG